MDVAVKVLWEDIYNDNEEKFKVGRKINDTNRLLVNQVRGQ